MELEEHIINLNQKETEEIKVDIKQENKKLSNKKLKKKPNKKF